MFKITVDKTHLKENLIANMLFPISAVAFFVLSFSEKPGYHFGIIIAGIIAVYVAGCSPSFWKEIKHSSVFEIIYGVLCSAGTCLAGHDSFITFYRNYMADSVLKRMAAFPEQKVSLIGWMLAAGSFFFVFVCLLFFLKKIKEVFTDSSVFDGVKWWECLVYAVVFVISSIMVYEVFTHTDAFYWARQFYDVIYTSDSPSIFRWNAFMTLTHQQNDLRQPLFAVFCAPFLGILNLISALFFIPVKAVLLDIGQIAMFIFANYLLARIMELQPFSRVAFVLLFSATQTYMLFTLMVEQYIVAYFWLMLLLYVRFIDKRKELLILYGAGGTLVTSMVLLPFMTRESPRKKFWAWVREMVMIGLVFIFLILAFCRFDVFYSMGRTLLTLTDYTGTSISFTERALQYLAFVNNVFLPPVSEIVMTDAGNLTWQLSKITEVNYTGMLILLLCVISMVINRKKQSTQIFAAWWAFSIVLMLFLGWGTAENGLILYSLYFGWNMIALLVQLAEKIGEILHVKLFCPIVCIVFTAYLFFVNFTAVRSMVSFLAIYYPL